MPISLLLVFNIFLPITQVLLIIFGVLIIYLDYKSNRDFSLVTINYFKWLILYSLYLIILTFFQGTCFSTYNNSFFIIHSILFFFIILLNKNSFNTLDIIARISLFFVSIFSIFSILTTSIFIITNTSLLHYINNNLVYSYLIYVAPPGKRVIGLMTNVNTYSYLLLYTIYIYIFLIIFYKKTKLKYLCIFSIFNNLFNFFITGSRGAILSLIISGGFFIIVLLVLMRENYHPKLKKVKIFITSCIVLSVIFIVFIFKFNFEISILLKNYFMNNIIRPSNFKYGSGRLYIWQNVIYIDKKFLIFGLSDVDMYNQIKSNLPNYSVELLNNQGRYHNMYITLLANYGIFALLGFFIFLFYSIRVFYISYKKSVHKIKIVFLCFGAQFLAFLISGLFEQLPLFNLSPHSLLFMFTWASLFLLSEIKIKSEN